MQRMIKGKMTFNMQSLRDPQGHSNVLPFLRYNRLPQISHSYILPSLCTSTTSICVSIRYKLLSINLWMWWCDKTTLSTLLKLSQNYNSFLPLWKKGTYTVFYLYQPHSACPCQSVIKRLDFFNYSERNTAQLFVARTKKKENLNIKKRSVLWKLYSHEGSKLFSIWVQLGWKLFLIDRQTCINLPLQWQNIP